MKVDELIDNICDETIENPENQTAMRSVIKSWMRQSYQAGYNRGVDETACHIIELCEKKKNPKSQINIVYKD